MTRPDSGPAAELARLRNALAALIHDADERINDDTADRQLILEHLLDALDELAASVTTDPAPAHRPGDDRPL